jgi:hypothetical protein
MFILNANEPKELAAYLHQQKWLGSDETIVSISKPGDGNMNCVLRIENDTLYHQAIEVMWRNILRFWLLQIAYLKVLL